MLRLATPVFFHLELTTRCNNNCISCGNMFNYKEAAYSLSVKEWKKILNKITRTAYFLKITGGEPLLHESVYDIINSIDNLDIPFSVFTNGRWRDPKNIVNFFKDKKNFKGFIVSLHGANSRSHDTFSGVENSFYETCNNIQSAVRNQLPVVTSSIITSRNYQEIGKIISLTESLGVKLNAFNRFFGLTSNQMYPSEDQLKIAIKTIKALQSKGKAIKFGICIPQCFCSSNSRGCLAGVTFCTIDPWGNVKPCNHSSLILGNLVKQSLNDIWRSQQLEYWEKLIPSECYVCAEFSICHGGCRAVASRLGVERDPLIKKPLQWKTSKKNKKEIKLSNFLKPMKNFNIRKETFGYILIYQNTVIPVSFQSKPIIDRLNGNNTLEAIHKTYGNEAIQIIWSLYEKGLVTFFS